MHSAHAFVECTRCQYVLQQQTLTSRNYRTSDGVDSTPTHFKEVLRCVDTLMDSFTERHILMRHFQLHYKCMRDTWKQRKICSRTSHEGNVFSLLRARTERRPIEFHMRQSLPFPVR